MLARTVTLTLLAAAALGACGRADQPLTGAAAPASPRAAAAPPVCVFFNVPALGAVFGAPVPNPPGTVVWVENAIPVSVNRFLLSGGGWAYNWMQIVNVPAAFTLGAGKVDRINNVDAGFDFTGLPFTPTTVTVDFYDQGGYENLSVNGSAIFVGPITAPPSPLGGVNVTTAWAPVAGGVQGTVKLSGGAIGKMLIGGQEFFIDDVCAYP